MCTSAEKKNSIAITKVHSERKKNKNNKSVGKAAPVWHPICGAQTKIKTKPKIYQETSPQKSMPLFLFYSDIFALYKLIM